MFRHLIVALLVLATPASALALHCGDKTVLLGAPDGSQAPLTSTNLSQTAPSTSGQYACSNFTSPCDGTVLLAAFSILNGVDGSVSEVGLFTGDGASRLASTGPLPSPLNPKPVNPVGLFHATINQGTDYLVCIASSADNTLTYRPMGPGADINNFFVASVFQSGSTQFDRAPFNQNCAAFFTPYPCCTGLGTGNCHGMADRTGVQNISPATAQGPLVVVGQ